MDPAVGRILDANINRAGEGGRVIEEYARFALDDAALCARMKTLRHDLQQVDHLLRQALPEPLERYRDTPGDVGTQVTTPTESTRTDAQVVARASCKRLEESLRVLEEYGKIVSTPAALLCEAMRYRLYDIERSLFPAGTRRERLAQAKLYVLITESLASTDAVTTAREAVNGGADVIQLREKDMEDGAFYKKAVAIREICREGGALFLLNDRPHIAQLADADGVHTGQGDLPVHLTRRIVGADRIIGRSTSAPAVAEQALADGADYIGVGPVYETMTKQHRAPVGLEYVTWASRHAALPYFCIGSINRQTLHGVLEAGAKAVAVCTAIIAAEDIAQETVWFKEKLVLAEEAALAGKDR